jgi:hypothetical protein
MPHTRRTFLKASALGSVSVVAQTPASAAKTVQTSVLTIGYEDSGQGFPIILLHGFPDDVRAFDDVTPPLVKAGYRVLVPYLRGYGPTRFRDSSAPRMGEQAAIGQDLVDFADALKLQQFAVAGYDWGCRAAASRRRYTRSACVQRCSSVDTPYKTSLLRPDPLLPKSNMRSGISGISTPSVAGRDSRPIGAACADSCGNSGRPLGISATKHTIAPRHHSTIPISSMW